jgi:hypothetical protein
MRAQRSALGLGGTKSIADQDRIELDVWAIGVTAQILKA